MIIEYFVIKILFLFSLLLVSAFFSGAEIAFTTFMQTKAASIAAEDHGMRKKVALWVENADRILITVLIINNFTNIVVTMLIFQILEDLLPRYSDILLSGISLLTAAVIIIFFCEVMPKMLGRYTYDKITFRLVSILYALSRALGFINSFFIGGAVKILGLAGIKRDASRPLDVTEQDIKTMIDSGERSGALEKAEKKMLKGVIELHDRTAGEVMMPRTEIRAIAKTATIKDSITMIVKEALSRIPVYEEDIDHIVGILYTRDIFKLIHAGTDISKEPVTAVMHEPHFVPETKPVAELLEEFRKEKRHMAIVVDEYGGTAGLVTIEDLLEEIVGDINDEYDVEEEKLIKQVGKDKYLVDAVVQTSEFEEFFKCGLSDDEDASFNTLGGYLFYRFGRVPDAGETVPLGQLTLKVHEADERRILKVLVEKGEE